MNLYSYSRTPPGDIAERWGEIANGPCPDPTWQRVAGFFEYLPRDDGWNDSFRVVDDDGMTFDLTRLRVFDGRCVRITIELDEAMERRMDGGPDPKTADIYEQIGLTRASYRINRARRQALARRER